VQKENQNHLICMYARTHAFDVGTGKVEFNTSALDHDLAADKHLRVVFCDFGLVDVTHIHFSIRGPCDAVLGLVVDLQTGDGQIVEAPDVAQRARAVPARTREGSGKGASGLVFGRLGRQGGVGFGL